MDIIKLPEYNIYIGHIHRALRHFITDRQYSQHLILVDNNTAEHCLPIIAEYLSDLPFKVITIPPGEAHKNIQTCQEIWSSLMNNQADRNALVLNLGGGVIGDMGGFCAGTFKRGIDFIQIPTTLLSQVDASVGGKLGIDFAEIKNSIGLFRNPGAVFIDPVFLKTLPKREIASGFAEIIKHCLIADQDQWNRIQSVRNLEQVDWTALIAHSVLIKKQIVESDPFEKGIRKALNFGHTIGHAIESFFLSSETPLLHGEAIALGMICEAHIAHQQQGLAQQELEQIVAFIKTLYPQPAIPKDSFQELVRLMRNDKKNTGNKINFSLIQPIGQVHVNQVAEVSLIENAVSYYNNTLG